MMETQNYWEDTSAHSMQVKYESLDGRSCKDEIYRMGIGTGYCEGNLNFATASEDDEVYTKKKVSRLFAMQRNKRTRDKSVIIRDTEDIKIIAVKLYMSKFLYQRLHELRQYQYLRYVNISRSNISLMPKNLDILSELEEINLSNNNLGSNENYNWSWLEETEIKNRLLVLNLNENSLTKFPIQITKLKMLMILMICNNKLTYLPQSIKNLKHLTYLDVSFNNVSYLPGSMCSMQVHCIDISNNSFSNNQECPSFYLTTPTLVELSAKTILDQRIKYDASSIPFTLIKYFDKAKYCCNCENACFTRYIREITNCIPASLVATVILKVNEVLHFECYFCSVKCRGQFHEFFGDGGLRRNVAEEV